MNQEKYLNPFSLDTKEVCKEDLKNLREWNSVWPSVYDSVWASVRDSIWESVWDSVLDSVKDSVRDSVSVSVWDSVWASVWAYISSLFPNVESWKGFENTKGNPFQSGIALWNRGLVPIYYQDKWHLYGGKDCKCLYVYDEIKEKLKIIESL